MTPKEEADKLYSEMKENIPKPTWFLYLLQYWLFKKWYVKRSCYNVINETIHFLASCNSFERVNHWESVKKEIDKL